MPPIKPYSRKKCFCEPGPVKGPFDQYCCILPPDSRINLCEFHVSSSQQPYYVSINSGHHTVIVCALEKFVDSTTGKFAKKTKTDFMLIGPNPEKDWETFVVFLEMREVLNDKRDVSEKVMQCKNTIDLFCKCKTNYLNFHADIGINKFVSQIGIIQKHRVAAAIVPALLSESRYLSSQRYKISCNQVDKIILIVPLSSELFKKDTITWEQILHAMGLIS